MLKHRMLGIIVLSSLILLALLSCYSEDGKTIQNNFDDFSEIENITPPTYYDVSSLPSTDIGLILCNDGYMLALVLGIMMLHNPKKQKI